MGILITIAICAVILIGFIAIIFSNESHKEKDPEYLKDKLRRIAEANYGLLNEVMTCPHCQTNGSIRTKHIVQKKGISGGKATAAVITGGLSTLAVGLSRKEDSTQAHCDNCDNTWIL